ncbi:MAG: DUF1569 domain-containing protein [Pseudomonadota bacterium]
MPIKNFDDVLTKVAEIEVAADAHVVRGGTPGQVLAHCAQSIQYSVSGFPENKPAWLQKTIGRLVARRFLRRGAMSHNLEQPIPGAPALNDVSLAEGVDSIRDAIAAFREARQLAPHFVFGELTPEDYEQMQAMHFADHFEAFDLS